MVKFLQAVFRWYYRLISPLLGARCRFAPSCSEYANQALETHGAIMGLWLTFKRILRCHPWGGHGFDPVPESDQQMSHQIQDKTQSDDNNRN